VTWAPTVKSYNLCSKTTVHTPQFHQDQVTYLIFAIVEVIIHVLHVSIHVVLIDIRRSGVVVCVLDVGPSLFRSVPESVFGGFAGTVQHQVLVSVICWLTSAHRVVHFLQ
jgi:hypothetical protein